MQHDTPHNEWGDGDKSLDGRMGEALRDIGIPPRPTVLEAVVREMRRDEPDFRGLARLIGADVALSAALLKTVNSPFFGYRNKARTVQDALMMLGLDLAASTVAAVILRRSLPAGPHLERFWDASWQVALLSSWLARELGLRDGIRREDAYTYALFRDCGIPVLMRRMHGYAETLAEANGESVRGFTEVEDRHHPTNHALVGSLMAQSWWLPENTYVAIRNHHAVDALRTDVGPVVEPGVRRLIALAQLGEHLMQEITGLNRTREWGKLGAGCLRVLGLDDEGVEVLLAPAGSLLEESAQLF